MRIWCVEDDENIRDLIEYALRGQSYEVKTFLMRHRSMRR